MDASITTNEVEQLFSQELSPLDIRSIGAFVLEQLGHIPESGERVSVNGIEFTIEQVTDRVIDRIRVKRLSQELQQSED
jgi:CBS domain containing-hemolysin-like protein